MENLYLERKPQLDNAKQLLGSSVERLMQHFKWVYIYITYHTEPYIYFPIMWCVCAYLRDYLI